MAGASKLLSRLPSLCYGGDQEKEGFGVFMNGEQGDCQIVRKQAEEESASFSSGWLDAKEVLDVVADSLRRFGIAGVVSVKNVVRVSARKVVAALQFSHELSLPANEIIVVAWTERAKNKSALHLECIVSDEGCEHPTISTIVTFMGRSIFDRLNHLEQERRRRYALCHSSKQQPSINYQQARL